MITIDNEFSVRQIVYVKTDTEQKPNIVTAIKVYDKDINYQCSCGNLTTDYCGFELSDEINVLAL